MTIARILGCVLVAGLGFGCAPAKPTLHIYNWADYVKPELLQRFEQQQGCRVVLDTFDSNESMYAKLKAGATGYDLIFPSSYMARIMDQQDMLQPLDHARLPNLKNVDPDFLKRAVDKAMRYSVPYMITITGLAYLESRVPEPEASWTMLDREDLKNRMTMLNDMRETIGAALKFLGYSLNTTNETELAEAVEVVQRWKKNLAKFENEQYKTGLASGEFLLVHGYSGDIMQVQEENDDIVFVVPKEGAALSCDDMVIPKDAREVDLAHAFINFMHDPEVAAENTEFIYYLCPNAPSYALLGADLRDDPVLFPPTDVRDRCEVIADLGEDNVKYTRAWDAIKASE